MTNKEIIKENTNEIIRSYYLYSESENYCELVKEMSNGELLHYPLPLHSHTSFKTTFIHQWKGDKIWGVSSFSENETMDGSCLLEIEKAGDSLEITLKEMRPGKPNPAVSSTYFPNWNEVDWGKLVWNPEIEDYKLEKNQPKSFYLFFEDYKRFEGEDGAIQFSFDFENHLVLKDKDPNKNFIWYQFDYTLEVGSFLHWLLNPYLPPEDKEVVIIPSEYGLLGDIWGENNYPVRSYYSFDWPEKEKNPDEDIYWENKDKWIEKHGEAQLVISYLPTHEENWKLEDKFRLTGTRWFKKLWEIFGEHGVPLVLKCYPGFIHVNLVRRFPEIFKKIDAIVELPQQIRGKFTGTGNQLVFFNCPWLRGQKFSFKEWLEKEWWDKVDEKLDKENMNVGPWNNWGVKK